MTREQRLPTYKRIHERGYWNNARCALVAAKWLRGMSQKKIAREFGITTNSPISTHIAALTHDWIPEGTTAEGLHDEDKRKLVALALRNWAASLDGEVQLA